MVQLHRITITPRHYQLVRRFMVDRDLPTARAATEEMIEVAATTKVSNDDAGGTHATKEHSREQSEQMDSIGSARG